MGKLEIRVENSVEECKEVPATGLFGVVNGVYGIDFIDSDLSEEEKISFLTNIAVSKLAIFPDFVGLDGHYYFDPENLMEANERYINKISKQG